MFELLPVEWCLCCVPLCCGMRGGVMAIAIVQICIGLLWLLASISTSITLVVDGIDEIQTGTTICSLIFFLIASSTWLVVGVVGIIATCNTRRIVTLDYNTLQTTIWYYRSSVAGFVIVTFLSLIGSMMTTLSVLHEGGEGQAESRTAAEIAVIIAAIWLVTVFGIVLQIYFLYVIWSYKVKLDAFYHGRKCGAFVVKNTLPYAAMTIDQPEHR